MAWVDKTGAGETYDKEKLTKDNVYTINDYVPRLDLGMVPFRLNDIPCGWCRFNKTFRPITKVTKSDENEIGWDWDLEVPMKEIQKLSYQKTKLRLDDLVGIYHSIRDIQDNPETCNETTGLIEFMKALDYKYRTPDILRVFCSKKNEEIINIYNRHIGKAATDSLGKNGWFGKDFPNEFQSVKANKKIGYKYKLMKGLYLHPHYRLPTKHRNTTPNITEDEAKAVFDFLVGK